MGKKTGRPLAYETPEALEAKIDDYFKSIAGELFRDKKGKPVFDKFGNPIIIGQRPPTITGLALFLGFTSRQALLNYQARKPFVDAVTRAKLRVEAYAEERLFDRDGAQGAKFNLMNNFKGWKDKPKDEGEIEALAKAAALLAGVHFGTDTKAD